MFKKVAIITCFVFQVLCLSQNTEFRIKAVYMEKFANFITWPTESAVNDTTVPFIISIIGDNPFDDTLEKLYSSKKIKNKIVEIRYISNITEIDDCNILFISKSERKNLDQILLHTAETDILLIGDTRGFGKKGVHINYYLSSEGTVFFELNSLTIKNSKLKFNLLLFEIAKVI